MLSDPVALTFSGLFVLVFGGIWGWFAWRQKQKEKTWPRTWIHVGRAPPSGIDEAMDIIAKHTPGMPQAGTVEWVLEPFSVGWTMAAGTVLSTKPIRIKVMFDERVERTALVHELGHVWSELTKQGFGESLGSTNPNTDQRFVRWFNTINSEIATALRR
jgi:hypothetical protein